MACDEARAFDVLRPTEAMMVRSRALQEQSQHGPRLQHSTKKEASQCDTQPQMSPLLFLSTIAPSVDAVRSLRRTELAGWLGLRFRSLQGCLTVHGRFVLGQLGLDMTYSSISSLES